MFWFFDSEDKLYLGSEDALFTEENPTTARMRAALIDAQMGWRIGRTTLTDVPPNNPRLRDTLEPERDALTALIMLEEGKL